MKCLNLICAITLLLTGCKKKDEFRLVTESAAFSGQTEVSSLGATQVKLHLSDAADGFGETVKISIEGLPSQIKQSMYPDSSIVVTDAGTDIYVTFTAESVQVNAVYPITFRFSWEGGAATREASLRITPYNPAKELVGAFGGNSNCDSTGISRVFQSDVQIDTVIGRINIRNFAALGEEVYVSAQVDSAMKRITVPEQKHGNVTLSGSGTYSRSHIGISCYFEYETRRTNCLVSMNRVQQ